jgi:hypothetical protein
VDAEVHRIDAVAPGECRPWLRRPATFDGEDGEDKAENDRTGELELCAADLVQRTPRRECFPAFVAQPGGKRGDRDGRQVDAAQGRERLAAGRYRVGKQRPGE